MCKHPPKRLYSWHAYNYKTGKKDILCVCCCECGEILTGAAEESEKECPKQPAPAKS